MIKSVTKLPHKQPVAQGTGGGGAGEVPIGGIIMFGSNTAGDVPAGWMLCNGAAISRVTFAALFALIGIVFGAGDGVTTFNLPPFNSRKPVGAGQGAGLSLYALGATGGEEAHVQTVAQLANHTHGQGSHTHSIDPHQHTVPNANTDDPDHTHTTENTAGQPEPLGGSGEASTSTADLSTDGVATPIDAAGGSNPFNVLDPYLAVGFIIRVS